MANRRLGFGLFQVIAALLAAAALVLAIAKLVSYVGDWIETRDAALVQYGVEKCQSSYKTRDNEQLRRVIAEKEKLVAEKAEREARVARDVNKLEAEYVRRLNEKTRDFDSFVADLNAGRIVYRDPGKAGPEPDIDRDGAKGSVAADTGGGAGQGGRGVLSREAAVFLRSEAERADKVVEKLNLCRGVLEEERR
jgi:hypothetical protein